MEKILFEIKFNALIKHSTSVSISNLIENSLNLSVAEERIKIMQRIVQDLIEINKNLETKLFELKIVENELNISILHKTIIPNSETENISSQFKIINETIPDSEAFKEMYKTKLRAGVIAGNSSKYPDLNIIDLGRELNKKITFSFDEIDSGFSYLNITIIS